MSESSKSSFANNKTILNKATTAAHSPSAIKKRSTTTKANFLMKHQVLESLKAELVDAYKNGNVSYYEKFIQKFLDAAIKDPNSKSASMLAQSIFTPELLDKLDEESNKAMSKDLDFIRYRIIKDCIDPQQKILLCNDGKKVKVACASRRAGKTEGAARLLVYRAITPNSPELYINKTFQMCLGQIWSNIKKVSEDVGLIIEKADSSTGTITFSNGSSILVKGNNDISAPDSLQGYKFRTIVIDESQSQKNMNYLIDTILRPTMADFTDSMLVLQGSPPRVPHTYFERAMNNSAYTQFRWNMFNNPYIKNPEKVIDDICMEKGITKDSTLIRREYMGESVYDTEAQVFKGYKTYEKVPEISIPNHIAIGVDFGFTDYSAVVTLVYNSITKMGYVSRVDKFNKSTVTDIISVINNHYNDALKMASEYGFDKENVLILCDSNEKSIVNELYTNYKLPAYTCYKYDKQYAISELSCDLRTGKITIPKNSSLSDEFDMTVYKRDESTDAVLPDIDDEQYHPDAMDALLYAYRQYAFDIQSRVGGQSSDLKSAENKNTMENKPSTLPPWMNTDNANNDEIIL